MSIHVLSQRHIENTQNAVIQTLFLTCSMLEKDLFFGGFGGGGRFVGVVIVIRAWSCGWPKEAAD